MKVLFVSSGRNGVVGAVVKNQGESLKVAGIKIDYFSIKSGIKGYLKAIPSLRRVFINGNYDLVHAHYALTGFVSILSIPLKKVLISYMGSDIYGDYNVRGRKIISSYLVMFIGMLIQPFVNRIIVKSENIEKFIFYKSKVSIIPNGVNLALFRPLDKVSTRTMLNLNQNKNYVLFMGDDKENRKNFQLLKFVKDSFNMNFEILNPYPINNAEVPAYLSATDILILTSFNEGSPNIIKEAMACNCPIVSTNVGDVKWVIGNTPGCFLTSFEPVDIAEKIKLAIDFRNNQKYTKGRERIIKLGLDSDTIAKRIIEVYQKVLKIEN